MRGDGSRGASRRRPFRNDASRGTKGKRGDGAEEREARMGGAGGWGARRVRLCVVRSTDLGVRESARAVLVVGRVADGEFSMAKRRDLYAPSHPHYHHLVGRAEQRADLAPLRREPRAERVLDLGVAEKRDRAPCPWRERDQTSCRRAASKNGRWCHHHSRVNRHAGDGHNDNDESTVARASSPPLEPTDVPVASNCLVVSGWGRRRPRTICGVQCGSGGTRRGRAPPENPLPPCMLLAPPFSWNST